MCAFHNKLAAEATRLNEWERPPFLLPIVPIVYLVAPPCWGGGFRREAGNPRSEPVPDYSGVTCLLLRFVRLADSRQQDLLSMFLQRFSGRLSYF
jgi:hypothetical protein